jgi:murein DD-endopeptidase MepM/ murein hydrolase activator NlpD
MWSFKVASMVLLLSALASVSIAAVIHSKEGAKPVAKAAPKAPATKAAEARVASVVSQAPPVSDDLQLLAARRLLMPVKGYDSAKLHDNFDELRGGKRRHEALDIMAPRGTPVVAVDDGPVAKLFTSAAGGITLYQFDPNEKFVYYYAHLDRYAEGVREGAMLKRGDTIGYVGSTGNAPASAPHLHFSILLLGPEKRWWKGSAVNPYPYLSEAAR